MKIALSRLLLVIATCIAGIGACTVSAQWYRQDIWTDVPLTGVAFTTESNGWIIDAEGHLYHTNDGGQEWLSENVAYPTHLWSIVFVDTLNGWIAGDNGLILRRAWVPETQSVKWHKIPSGTNADLLTVTFINPRVGWCGGEKATILNTTDSGRTWTKQYQASADSEVVRTIVFLDSLNGWAAGTNLLKTSDGGVTWMVTASPTVEEINDMFFADQAIGWMVARGGTILKTTDSGTNWTAQSSTTGVTLRSVHFVTALEGWVIGGDVDTANCWKQINSALHTTDGGVTWVQEGLPQCGWLMSIFALDRDHVWASGNRATILRRAPVTSVILDVENRITSDKYQAYDLLGKVVPATYSGLVLRYSLAENRWKLALSHD